MARSGQRRAQRRARLCYRLSRLVELRRHAEESVEHPGIARGTNVDARLAQPSGVGLALVTQRLVACGDAQPGREIRDVHSAQRRRITLAALLRIREVLVPE